MPTFKTAIFGGSFNPFHVGHLRHAVEAAERLGLERVLVTPSADHPFKGNRGVLPFSLRRVCIEAMIAGEPLLAFSGHETECGGTSYTFNTVSYWKEKNGGERPILLMGSENLEELGTWYRGGELIEIADIAVLSREGGSAGAFHAAAKRIWPDAAPATVSVPDPDAMGLKARGGTCVFITVPRIDISSTTVRAKWRAGQSLAGLLTPEAIQLLLRNREIVDACWGARRQDEGTAVRGMGKGAAFFSA
ncbi:MAG: nicotinate-nicotinamide nucleotide adenylyltransferase [Mailhella sp.]|nr:nicotinate-nicotinamide nucleotide adenylyltransferase [Mailhella sp.]